MVVGAFPIAKLASLALKQVSKPLATTIKNRAKSSPIFRNYICMPPAQLYHWIEVNIKMRMLNLGKPTDVSRLNEAMAIELGAELLGEGIIFAVAAACLIAEYVRSSKKDREKEENREKRFQDLQHSVVELELRLAEQDVRIRELNRMSYGMHTSIANLWSGGRQQKENSEVSQDSSTDSRSEQNDKSPDILSKALKDVNVAIMRKKS